ncbi:Type II secretion system protein G precursor [Polystyrenella longa]|uniref:Type II secretion system core protein G n=1 Tax=Polystyrenella longa TaxID=2528007 RepID=A0A518CRG5_9PLAN|nr:type II secretion system major pseudopilin GspG [Polystyrenella longa]QDU81794.1 Type II secretion system protein G precursor [Polystyrenella longa]
MQKRINRTTRQRKGFTLIEVLVVLGIIVLLATMVGPRILGTREKADVDATFTQVKSFESALELYQYHMKTFPSTEIGLAALVEEPSEDAEGAGNADNWEGPYMEEIPADPWGNDFQYEYEAGDREPTIWSFGPDGEDGTEDDITSAKGSKDGEDSGGDLDASDLE